MDGTEARLGVGGNNPPEPTPFELARDAIDALYDEAKGWLDGEPVSSQGMADGVAKLLAMLREAVTNADEARKAENVPFDTGKAEVQARYAPLIADTKGQKGKAILAIEICKGSLAPWLDKLDKEKREKAEQARLEAEAKARAAQEAMRAARHDNLEEREHAEELFKDAKKAEVIAGRAARDTAKANTGIGRAVSLRTSYRPVLTDPFAAAQHYWNVSRPDIETLLLSLAERDIRQGRRTIPGFNVIEEKTAV